MQVKLIEFNWIAWERERKPITHLKLNSLQPDNTESISVFLLCRKLEKNHSKAFKQQTPNFFLQLQRNLCFTKHKFLEDTDMELLLIFYCCQMTCPPISLLTPKLYYSILSLPLCHHPFPPNFPIRPCFANATLDAQMPSASPVSAPSFLSVWFLISTPLFLCLYSKLLFTFCSPLHLWICFLLTITL